MKLLIHCTFPYFPIHFYWKQAAVRETQVSTKWGRHPLTRMYHFVRWYDLSIHYKTTVLLRGKKDTDSFSLEAAASKPAANQSHRCCKPKVTLRKMKPYMNRKGLRSLTDKSILRLVLSLGGCVCTNSLKRSVNKYLWILMLAPLQCFKRQQPDVRCGIRISMRERLYPVLHWEVCYLHPTLN